jgi:large subunit ribosomal protein L13
MTFNATPHLPMKNVQRQWYIIDGKDVVLGRLAAMAVTLLRGKNKASYTPHMDQGDGVIVINAKDIKLTGAKLVQKTDFRASGYPGGQTLINYGQIMREKPERAVELAVYGMLPKSRLRDRMMRRLKIFKDAEGQKVYTGAKAIDMKNPKIRAGGPYVAARQTVKAS